MEACYGWRSKFSLDILKGVAKRLGKKVKTIEKKIFGKCDTCLYAEDCLMLDAPTESTWEDEYDCG